MRKWDIAVEDKGAFSLPQSAPLTAPSSEGAFGALPRQCNSTVAVCMEAGKRALSERPYIYDGKCYGFAGRQLVFVMFVCREAERLPYERTGGWAGLPESGARMGDCAAHLIS